MTIAQVKQRVFLLSKDDPRYLKWRESLRNRLAPWNKGLTKENGVSVKKISQTFKLGTDKPKLITFTTSIVKKVIQKQPHVYKTTYENAAKIDLYQKFLSKRLGISTGKRKYVKYRLPKWIIEAIIPIYWVT